MSDQDQEFHQVQGLLNYQLSALYLDNKSMASIDAVSDRAAGADDMESYRVELIDPSPPRSTYGNNTPLKRRSPSSTYSPPKKPAGADSGFHCLISEGYQIFNLPSDDNRSATSVQKDSSVLRSCCSLNCAGNRPIPPAEVSNRGTLPENQTRRSLFPPPLNVSGATAAHSLPPPRPLARAASDPTRLPSFVNQIMPMPENNPVPKTDTNSLTAARPLARAASDPTRLSSLMNPILPIGKNNPVPSTDPNSLHGLPGSDLGFDSTQENPSIKRLKRVDSAKKIRQQMNEIKELIDQMVEEDNVQVQINTETDLNPSYYKVLGDQDGSYINGGSSAEEPMNNSEPNEARSQEELPEKEIQEDELEAEADIVKAQRVGEGFLLEFKCRCGSGYSVGIFGNSCFYKLI